ncbi:PadR family transcriptional regulator [Paenibacillus periandrae]|uniref:PadR family transcriptional regulator n=1 Tax=Paenibacillus periandrae TaxID=1761741 RepID=UPI001F08F30B|nr:PadR family transcriptional regulator [Paenibacillus periandrae]
MISNFKQKEEFTIIPLLILGLLKDCGQSSAYELLNIFKERNYRYLVHVTKGSLYYNLQKLANEGFVRLVEVVSINNYPEQHIYEITEEGNDYFDALMEKYSIKTDDFTLTFYMTTLFAHQYDPEQYKRAISVQIEKTQKKIEEIDFVLNSKKDIIYDTAKSMMKNVRAHHELNLKWFHELLEQ